MSVATLREAIAVRSRELLPAALLEAGVNQHKKHWRDCDCAWCAMKQEATLVIGSHVPARSGVARWSSNSWISEEGHRDVWRAEQRYKYRQQLTELEAQ